MACVGQYRKLAACIFYNTPILGLLSVTFQAGVPYNALTWLVWYGKGYPQPPCWTDLHRPRYRMTQKTGAMSDV